MISTWTHLGKAIQSHIMNGPNSPISRLRKSLQNMSFKGSPLDVLGTAAEEAGHGPKSGRISMGSIKAARTPRNSFYEEKS